MGILYAIKLINAIRTAIEAGKDVAAILKHGSDALHLMQMENRDPSDAEWAELDDKIDSLRIALQASE